MGNEGGDLTVRRSMAKAGTQQWNSVVELLSEQDRWCEDNAGMVGLDGPRFSVNDFRSSPEVMYACERFCLVGACLFVYKDKASEAIQKLKVAVAKGWDRELSAEEQETFSSNPDAVTEDDLMNINDISGWEVALNLAKEAGI